MRRLLVAALVFFVVSFPSVAHAQITNVGDDTMTPVPGAGHDYIHMLSETVNPANGSVSLRIQVPTPKGRGISLPFSFAYDSNGVNHVVSFNPGSATWQSNTSYLAQGGWSYSVPLLNIHAWTVSVAPNGQGNPSSCTFSSNYVFQDSGGGRHDLSLGAASYESGTLNSLCGSPVINGGDPQLTAALLTTPTAGDSSPITVVADADGTAYYFANTLREPVGNGNSSLPTFIEDRNGNQMVPRDNGNGVFTFTDTAGRPVISSNGFGGAGATNSITIGGLIYQVTWTSATAKYSVSSHQINPPASGIQCNPIPSVSATQPVVSSITLPNGQQYKFSYDSTYGLLNQITYPTGAWVKYTWKLSDTLSELADFDGQSCYTDPSGHPICTAQPNVCEYQYNVPVVNTRTVGFTSGTNQVTQTFTYSTTWGGNGTEWTQKTTKVVTTDNVLVKSFTTDYTYSSIPAASEPYEGTLIASQIPVESTIQYYDWGGTSPIRTVTKTWQNQFEMTSQSTTLDNNYTSKVAYTYGPGDQITEKDEYDYGSGGPGPLLRRTVTNYQTFPSTQVPPVGYTYSPYTAGSTILDRPSSIITYNGGGTRFAETDYFYNNSTSSASATQHDETNYGPGSSVPRGNAGTVTKQCFPGCTNASTTYVFDETGQVLSKTDPCGNTTCSDMTGTNHTTIYSYTDSYSSCGGTAPPSGNTNAYLTKITDPLSHTQSYCYGYTDGQLRGSTDPNNQVTSYAYSDPLLRLTSTTYPDTGKTTLTYNDSVLSITTSKLITAGVALTNVSILDGMGHVIETELTSDPAGTDYTVTTYNGEGLVNTVTNPYRGTSDPTYGTTSYSYDALNRTTKVMHPDSTYVQTTYTGRATQVSDEGNGTKSVKRISQTDALGRLNSVCEVSSTALSVGASPAPGACGQDIGGTGFLTSYEYDILGDLTGVLQAGLNQRSSIYDSLLRLTSSANPESGSFIYAYDSNGNVTARTDARKIATTYTYDVLNRVTQKSYSDGTPTAYFIYDIKPDWNVAQTNIIGRMTEAYTNQSELLASVFGYDSVGRVVLNNQVAGIASPAGGYTLEYTYDLLGDMTTATNGLGSVTFTYGYNSAAQLTGVTSSISDASHPSSLLSSVLYNAPGGLTSASMGTITSTSGISESRTYDKRLRTVVISTGVNTPTGFVGLVGMTYGYAPNGDVTSPADGPTGNWTFTYDDFNRLLSTVVPVYSASPYAYVYDRYGNRWKQTGNGSCTAGTAFCISFDANNHVTGGILTYDAAGNVIADNMHHYTYDAENRLTQVDAGTTASYLYDALGRRVQKTTAGATVNDLYDLNGHAVTELSSTGEWNRGEVYAGSRHLVTYVNSLTYFSSIDALGSERVRSTQTESSYESCASLPFGDGQNCFGSATGNVSPLHFTGKERDTESGLDNFGARYMGSSLGRFMSPDWSDKPQSVPYAVFNNPQTLNLYSFVLNNPVTNRDLDGHWCIFGLGSTCPKPPPPPSPSMGTFFTAMHNYGGLVAAAGTVGNATQAALSPANGQTAPQNATNSGQTTTLHANPFGNLVAQAGGNVGSLNASLSYVPSTGNVFINGAVGNPDVTGAFAGLGTTTNLDQSGYTVSATAFFGGGGGLSANPRTGDTTTLFGFGTPSAIVSGGYTSPLFSVPAVTVDVNVYAIPQGISTMSIGEGLSTYQDWPQ